MARRKIVIRQNPYLKDWEVNWHIGKGRWRRETFKTKTKAKAFAKKLKKVC